MMGHAPILGFFFAADIALPFLWLASAVAWLVRTSTHRGTNLYVGLLHVRHHSVLAIVLLTVLTSTLAMCLRQMRHLAEVPGDFVRMPFFILFSTLVLMPVRLLGFVRLGHLGSWGTRADAYSVGQPVLATDPGGGGGDGDPRALIPYLIASAVLVLGVAYDVLFL